MVVKDAGHSIKETVGAVPWSRKLYNNAEEFWKESEGLHYAYLVYQTLNGRHAQFKPDAIFYVGKSPAAYLKKVNSSKIPEDKVRDWQRFLWNQTVVPMLIVQSRTQIHVYTAYTQPIEEGSQERIASILENVADTIELDQLLTAIEAGTIYEEKPEAFYKTNAVDRYLLNQLNVAAVQLANTQKGGVNNRENLEFVHQFLTRLLFVCYLIERGMIKGEHFDDEALKKLRPKTEKQEGYFIQHLFEDLGTYAKKRDAICKLFVRVKERFNGSLFPDNGIKGEKDRYNEPFIRVLDLFLRGHNLQDSQLMLGFWAYDFSVIPIETISAIYESFLGEQGKIREILGEGNTKRTAGAYYTPLHLAELTADIALENVTQRTGKAIHELEVLDPACGSGVFLVSLFGRMAESLLREKNYSEDSLDHEWAFDLQGLLQNLYGIDINPTACHITCFSLYLALLEHLLPRDVEYLCQINDSKKALRPLLTHHADGYNTIYHYGLFNPELPLKKTDFDVVIGNPPWVSREKQEDKDFLKWQDRDHEVYGPGFQIAHGFMWKAPEFLCKTGIACLLLPSAVFLNSSTNKFQKEWLSSHAVEKVINFSDLSFFLFEDADRPCMAVRFTNNEPTTGQTICYESPKTDTHSQFAGPIYIREEDTTALLVKDVIYAAGSKQAPVIWKSHFWGSWRDQRLLSRLNNLPKLCELTSNVRQKSSRWNKGQGCQPYTQTDAKRKRKVYYPWWDDSLGFLSTGKHIDLAISTLDTTSIPPEFNKLRMSPSRSLFENPKVVISQGSRNMKVAYCDFPVLFRHSIQAISGPKEDANLLRFLAVVIKSDLIQYYLFHTSANWGTERDKVHFHELLSLPFFLPKNSIESKKSQEIVDEVSSAIKAFEKKIRQKGWFGREYEAHRLRSDILEPLIQNYYDIDKYEKMIINDTLRLSIESSTPSEACHDIPTLERVQENNCRQYAQTLCEMLNNFGKGSSFKVNGEVIEGNPYSIAKVSLVNKICKDVPVIKANEKLSKIFKRMEKLLEQKQGRFVFCQNLKVFDGNDLYILKPMQMRFWTRTAALNDADEVAGALLKL